MSHNHEANMAEDTSRNLKHREGIKTALIMEHKKGQILWEEQMNTEHITPNTATDTALIRIGEKEKWDNDPANQNQPTKFKQCVNPFVINLNVNDFNSPVKRYANEIRGLKTMTIIAKII